MEPNLNIAKTIKDKDLNQRASQPSQISTPQKNSFQYSQLNSQSSKNETSTSQLKDKIIEQATRLTNLEQYKALCEKRIHQLTPSQQFPLTESNLIQLNEASDPEAKSKIMAALRKETLLNEQQRNYIELLKETLETNLIKTGISGLLQSSSQYQSYKSDQGKTATLADFMVDFSNCRREIESLKQDINVKANLLNDKEQEILFINKRLEDMAIQSSQAQGTYQNEKSKLEQMTKSMNDLNEEKSALSREITAIKKQNQSLQLDINDYQSLHKSNERKLQSLTGQLEEMAFDYNEYLNQKALIKQYEDKIDSMAFEYTQIANDRKENLNDISQLKEILDKKSADIAKLKEIIKGNETDYQKERRSLISLGNEHEVGKKKAEGIICELNLEINHNQQLFADLSAKLSHRDNDFNALEEQYQAAQLKYKELYLQMTTVNEQNEKRQAEAKDYSTQLCNKIDALTEESHSLKEKIIQMTDEASNQHSDIALLLKDSEEAKIAMKNLSDEYDKLFIQYQQSQNERNKFSMEKGTFIKEAKYWKEKYEKDMNERESSIKELNEMIEEAKAKEVHLSKDIEKGIKANEALSNALKEKSDKEMVLLSQMSKLKQMNDALSQSNSKAKEDLQVEKLSLTDVLKTNNEIEAKCNELLTVNKELTDNRKLILTDLNNTKLALKEKSTVLNELSSAVFCKKNKLKGLKCNSEAFTAFLLKMGTDVQEYISCSASEIERLTSIAIHLEETLNESNIQLTLLQKDKESIDSQFKDIQLMYNDISIENKELKDIKSELLHQLDHYNETLHSFQELSRNQENDLFSKKTMLTNASYQIDSYEDKIMLLENERAYLETIILRMSKMFPNGSLLQSIQSIIDLNYDIEAIRAKKVETSQTNESYVYLQRSLEEKIKDKEYQNDLLLKELKKAEDYLKLIKENSLEAQYLNKQLTRQLMEYQKQSTSQRESFQMNSYK